MGHIAVAILLITISHRIQNIYADLSVPFAHDFNTSLHGWHVGEKFWHWTGHSNLVPNTTNIPFDSDVNYIWSQNSCLVTQEATHQLLYSELVTNIIQNTKFHLKYWFTANDADCGFLSFSLLNNQSHIVTKTITDNSSNEWDDVTIDCQLDNCCSNYHCDLTLFISGSVGCSDAEDLILIRSVSATVSEEVIPADDSKLMNHTVEMSDSYSTAEHRPSSSITSNSSTTSLGSVEATPTPIKRCQLDRQNQRIQETLSLNAHATLPYELESKEIEVQLSHYDLAKMPRTIATTTASTEKSLDGMIIAKFGTMIGLPVITLLIISIAAVMLKCRKVICTKTDDQRQLIINEPSMDQPNLV